MGVIWEKTQIATSFINYNHSIWKHVQNIPLWYPTAFVKKPLHKILTTKLIIF